MRGTQRDSRLSTSISEIPLGSFCSMSFDFWELYLNNAKPHSADGLEKMLKLYLDVSTQQHEFTQVLCSASKDFLLRCAVNVCWCITAQLNATFSPLKHLLPYSKRHPPAPSRLFSYAHPWIHLNSRLMVKREGSGPTHLVKTSAQSLTFRVTLGVLPFPKCQFQLLHMQKGCHNAWVWFLIWEPWGHLYFEIQIFFFFGFSFSER